MLVVEVTVVTVPGRRGLLLRVVQTRRWWRRWQTFCGLLVRASPSVAAARAQAASAHTASGSGASSQVNRPLGSSNSPVPES